MAHTTLLTLRNQSKASIHHFSLFSFSLFFFISFQQGSAIFQAAIMLLNWLQHSQAFVIYNCKSKKLKREGWVNTTNEWKRQTSDQEKKTEACINYLNCIGTTTTQIAPRQKLEITMDLEKGLHHQITGLRNFATLNQRKSLVEQNFNLQMQHKFLPSFREGFHSLFFHFFFFFCFLLFFFSTSIGHLSGRNNVIKLTATWAAICHL